MDFFPPHSAAADVFVLACTALCGLGLGSVRFRGIGLGSAGVLFAGILLGHFGLKLRPETLDFVRDFGLILFVFTIGLQLGPGFFASLRKEGLKLNALALGIVAAGFALALGSAAAGIDVFAVPGLFAGATTNTPSLGAAQQTMQSLASRDLAYLSALAYAIAYPAAIAGIILMLLILRRALRINIEEEASSFYAAQKAGIEPVVRMNVIVQNRAMDGVAISDIPGRREKGITISRIKRKAETEVQIARHATVLHIGDILLLVGTAANLESFAKVLGRRANVDLAQSPSSIAFRRVVATRKEILGKTLREIGLDHIYGVTVTRMTRGDLEMTAVSDLRLKFGDQLHIVGEEEHLNAAAAHLGDSVQALNKTNFLPVFVGIALGVLLGSIPISFPSLPVPVRLGIAGGPLLLAILLGRIGKIGPLVWHMPANANLAFRELGITLFLACVGLKAGEKFFEVAVSSMGLSFLGAGFAITCVPLFAGG